MYLVGVGSLFRPRHYFLIFPAPRRRPVDWAEADQVRGFPVTMNSGELKFLQFLTLREKKLENVTASQQSPLMKIKIVAEQNVKIVSQHIPGV